jgi:phospholipase/carboxylesterase
MTESELLSTVEIEPEVPARASVIWLHGLGADGHDFEPVVPMLELDPALGVRFVFPHAPSRPVTINMGMVMPAWYDVRSLDLRRDADESGIRTSARQLEDLVERENRRGIPCERIVLAGFSQGGAIALHTGLRHPRRLAGLMVLSSYLVLDDTFDRERSPENADVPIFLAHGTMDPLVAPERGAAARDRLVQGGYTVEWHTYPMAHQVCPDEIADAGRWITRVL